MQRWNASWQERIIEKVTMVIDVLKRD